MPPTEELLNIIDEILSRRHLVLFKETVVWANVADAGITTADEKTRLVRTTGRLPERIRVVNLGPGLVYFLSGNVKLRLNPQTFNIIDTVNNCLNVIKLLSPSLEEEFFNRVKS